MRKLFFSLPIIYCLSSHAQKNEFAIKKGDIKLNGNLIATYDGKGGVFKPKQIGVFLPNGKDTLIAITELVFDPRNPLWPELTVYYSVRFPGSDEPGFYLKHPNPRVASGRMAEKDILELVFRDSLPSPINNAQLDNASIASLRNRCSYDHDKIVRFIKNVEDTVATINSVLVKRDLSKPVTFRTVKTDSDPMESSTTLEIYQDNVLLGRLIKKLRGGNFPKATYTIWKSIQPITVDGIELKYSPVAFCETSPSFTDIPVNTTAPKKELKVKGDYSQLESAILNILVANKWL